MKHLGLAKRAALAAAAILIGTVPAGAQHVFSGNIFHNNLPDDCRAGETTPFDACDLLRNLFIYNDEIDPQLADPYNVEAPNFIPALTSPALGSNGNVVVPVVYERECDDVSCPTAPPWALIENVCYRGAFAPAEAPWNGGNWLAGWTYYNFDGEGRTDIDYGKPLVIKTGSIGGTETWTSDNNYLLRGIVSVEDGAVLTIEPGTVVFGEKASIGTLNVARGGKIYAVGTAAAPIILTSDQEPGSMTPGDFGGLVMNGWAIANCADCLNGESCVSEGAPTLLHCGDNDCDDSGELRYLRIEYSGNEIAPDNELNSFTFNSVGNGTRTEYLQAFRGSDDLFEWFGGTVTAKYLFGNGGWDDGLDWQMGYRGNVQFSVIQMWSDNSDRGVEADNNESDFNAPCRSNPVFSNITLVNTDNTGGSSTSGIHLRRGTDAQFYNSIVIGWPGYGLRVVDNATVARGLYPEPPLMLCNSPAGVEPMGTAGGMFVGAFPNPVVDQTQFSFQLPTAGRTRLCVYDPAGRAVADLVEGELAAGTHTVVWNLPAERPAGTYFYRLQSGADVRTGRIIAVR